MLRDDYYKQSTAAKWNEIPQKIKNLATYIVDNDYYDVNHEHLKGEPRNILIGEKSIDMFLGQKLCRNEYILKSTGIGIVLTIGTYLV